MDEKKKIEYLEKLGNDMLPSISDGIDKVLKKNDGMLGQILREYKEALEARKNENVSL